MTNVEPEAGMWYKNLTDQVFRVYCAVYDKDKLVEVVLEDQQGIRLQITSAAWYNLDLTTETEIHRANREEAE